MFYIFNLLSLNFKIWSPNLFIVQRQKVAAGSQMRMKKEKSTLLEKFG